MNDYILSETGKLRSGRIEIDDVVPSNRTSNIRGYRTICEIVNRCACVESLTRIALYVFYHICTTMIYIFAV